MRRIIMLQKVQNVHILLTTTQFDKKFIGRTIFLTKHALLNSLTGSLFNYRQENKY